MSKWFVLWSQSPGKQSLSENQPRLSAGVGRFSHRAGHGLLLDRVVILACPTARPVCAVITKIFRNNTTHTNFDRRINQRLKLIVYVCKEK
jgi:hypothetical protein